MRTLIGSTAAPSVRAFFTLIISLLMVVAFQVAVVGDADAKKRKRYYKKSKVSKKSRGNPRYAAFVIDAKTGKVLHSRNGNARRYPASLTKMMTLYLVFEDLKSGRINKRTRLVMSKAGARREPSKIGLRAGQSISMEQAILSLVTKSANDVATALGDQLAGSERKFAQRMTRKARQLGMSRTTFKNANGLTARGQVTTASDMAKLGLALREHFPRRYGYFKTRVFKLGKRRYKNHNRLLGNVRGVDGIKTGYTRASGFNLVSSVSSRGRKIVAVVMGGRSGRSRNAQMKKLIRAYLPKASRGKGRRLVAAARSSRGSSSKKTVALKKSITSKASKTIASRVASAHSVKTPKTKDIKKVSRALVALAPTQRPTPELRKTMPAKQLATTDKITTATVSSSSVKKTGWQIQIAASDNQSKALEMLKTTKRKNRKLLSRNKIFTQKVVKNGTILYRARFSGFASKASAQRACRILKRRRYNCLAFNG